MIQPPINCTGRTLKYVGEPINTRVIPRPEINVQIAVFRNVDTNIDSGEGTVDGWTTISRKPSRIKGKENLLREKDGPIRPIEIPEIRMVRPNQI
mgnify:FL=1|jgi:hypothetical protein